MSTYKQAVTAAKRATKGKDKGAFVYLDPTSDRRGDFGWVHERDYHSNAYWWVKVENVRCFVFDGVVSETY